MKDDRFDKEKRPDFTCGRFLKPAVCLLMGIVFTVTSSAPFLGPGPLRLNAKEADKRTTAEKLEDAKKTQEETEEKIDETADRISSLKNSKSELQNNLDNLNSQLSNVSDRIADIEEQVLTKQAEIDATQLRIEETIREQEKQYGFIKARIRTMYEAGEENFLELLTQTKSFRDFLNRAEYIERINEYDHNMLERYKETVAETKEKKALLEEERRELEELQSQAKSEQEKVQGLVNSTKNSITAYAGEITEAEAEALAYEAKLVAAKNSISNLKAQLAKEEELARLSQSMAKRTLAEVSVGGGEKELLACIIQCEAGGEPYAGKIAVGAVIMNRVMSGAFPNTITGVVYQSGQFEPVASGRLAIRLSQGANAECRKAAAEVLAGANNIGECLFFRTIVPGISGTIIGHHVFYLYWTGKYSGYGTANDHLGDNIEQNTSGQSGAAQAEEPDDEDALRQEEEKKSEEEQEEEEEEEEDRDSEEEEEEDSGGDEEDEEEEDEEEDSSEDDSSSDSGSADSSSQDTEEEEEEE